MTPQGERDDVGETLGQERIRRTGLYLNFMKEALL